MTNYCTTTILGRLIYIEAQLARNREREQLRELIVCAAATIALGRPVLNSRKLRLSELLLTLDLAELLSGFLAHARHARGNDKQ